MSGKKKIAEEADVQSAEGECLNLNVGRRSFNFRELQSDRGGSAAGNQGAAKKLPLRPVRIPSGQETEKLADESILNRHQRNKAW